MRYFATVSGSASEANVEEKVLASNPIMEVRQQSLRLSSYILLIRNMLKKLIDAACLKKARGLPATKIKKILFYMFIKNLGKVKIW